jgi:hypothetical protein
LRAADLLEPSGELVGRKVEQWIELVLRLPEPAQSEQHGGQPLLRSVVQVPLDPPPLRVGDLDQPSPGGP